MVTENLLDCEQIYFTIEVFFSQEDSVSSRFNLGFFVLIHPESDYAVTLLPHQVKYSISILLLNSLKMHTNTDITYSGLHADRLCRSLRQELISSTWRTSPNIDVIDGNLANSGRQII